MTDEQALPTVMLVEGAMYWVLPRHGTPELRWTVAKWEVGCFWGICGEITPAVISGPIPPPADTSPQASERSDEDRSVHDEQDQGPR